MVRKVINYRPLEDLAYIFDNLRKPINNVERANRIANKSGNELYPYYGATGQLGYIDGYLSDGEFVLVGEDGAPFLKPYASKAYLISGKCWVNNHAHILKAKGSNRFLCYYLNFIDYKDYVSGTTRLKLTQAKMRKIKVPDIALEEQNRIVNKIDELFSKLDKAEETLLKIKSQLEIYEQAVLKEAFEGKLSYNWRKQNYIGLEEIIKSISFAKMNNKHSVKMQEEIELPSIPDNWQWISINDITNGVEYGTSKKSSKSGEIPVVRMGNIQNGKIDWSDLVYSSDEEEIEKYKLHYNDVLFNRTNSPELVGKTAVYKGEKEAIFAGYLIRINQFECINSDYLTYYLNSFLARQYSNRVKTDGVNQSNINGNKLKSYPFPLCSLQEQEQIVVELEARLSEFNEILEVVEKSLMQTKALKQSILKEAFEGKLV